jgi:pimeloyl-ACP methyl ester carboxylesterase
MVGHSLGAIMTAGYCANYGRASNALLISPARGYGGADLAEQKAQVRSERLANLEKLGIPEMARLRSSRLLSDQASPEAQDWVRWNMASLNNEGYRQAIELLCGDDIYRYAPLAMPVRVACGEGDAITPPDGCRAIAEKFAAPFEFIPVAGHASPVEAVDAVRTLLLSVSQSTKGDSHE